MTRYVITHINKDKMRTILGPMQGRNTFSTVNEAQTRLDAIMTNNNLEMLQGLFGLPLEVRPVDCYEGHHDPKTCWFT